MKLRNVKVAKMVKVSIVAIFIALMSVSFVSAGGLEVNEQYITNDTVFAYPSSYQLKKGTELFTVGDNEAIIKMLKDNQMYKVKEGVKVYIVDEFKYDSIRYYKIRPKGHTVYLYCLEIGLKRVN